MYAPRSRQSASNGPKKKRKLVAVFLTEILKWNEKYQVRGRPFHLPSRTQTQSNGWQKANKKLKKKNLDLILNFIEHYSVHQFYPTFHVDE